MFVLERETEIGRETQREGRRRLFMAMQSMVWTSSYGSLQSDLCGHAADSPDTR